MLIDDIALTLQAGIGPRTAVHLLSCFGSAASVFNSSYDELIEKAELKPDLAKALLKRNHHRQAELEIKYCEKYGITPISSTSHNYPPMLRECLDYPHVLYFMGNPEVLQNRMISVVGTRKMSTYGQKFCDKLIEELASIYPDVIIVSGLAYGIDSACHRASLANNLRTVGVIANQLPEIYPSQHRTLASEMMKRGGGVLTEYNSLNKEKGVNFVPRNRIVAGLSEATIIVESPLKGGSMITAGMADGYHRILMAAPGRAFEQNSEGTNHLIKNNKALMVCSAEDVARELMWERKHPKQEKNNRLNNLTGEGLRMLTHIEEGEQIGIDAIAEKTGMDIQKLTPLLFELEFDGYIKMLPGKVYERA